MRIKLFTHTDADGVACYIEAVHNLGENNVDVVYCDYNNVDEKIAQWLTDWSDIGYDKVIITDISVGEHVAMMLDDLNKANPGYVQLLDHHATALWLNQYEWARVAVYHDKEETTKTCGASLLEEWFAEIGLPIEDHTSKFVEKIRRYDTWEWHDKYNDIEPKEMNDLLTLYGRKGFIDDMLIKIDIESPFIVADDRKILDIHQNQIDRYIKKKARGLRSIDVDDYRIGVVFAEQYSSEMGNVLSKAYEAELDMIMMINMDTLSASLRTIHDNIDVGAFAKKYGGGGHKKAAGMPLNPNLKKAILTLQFGTC